MKKRIVLVAGTVRNVEDSLLRDLSIIQKALSPTCILKWLFIESDSDDDSIACLMEARCHIKDFDYLSLGRLSTTISAREDRLAYCRNVYLKELESSTTYADVEYLFVVDCDCINSRLTAYAIDTCWLERKEWDACFPNQNGPYHDIYALRCHGWCMDNITECLEFANMINSSYKEKMMLGLYSKMINIRQSSPWIKVDSAFGGCALYKRSALLGCKYHARDLNGNLQCEHVGLHQMMKERGAKLYINPRFINSDVNEHSKALVFPWYLVTELRFFFDSALRAATSARKCLLSMFKSGTLK